MGRYVGHSLESTRRDDVVIESRAELSRPPPLRYTVSLAHDLSSLAGAALTGSAVHTRMQSAPREGPIGVKVARASIDTDVFEEARAGAAQALAFCGESNGWLVVE